MISYSIYRNLLPTPTHSIISNFAHSFVPTVMSHHHTPRLASKKEKAPIPSMLDLKVVHLETPLVEGYLYKKSHLFDSFNKRYFILYRGFLFYYNKKDDFDKDISHGNLKNRVGFIVLNRVYLTKPDRKPQGGRYCFVLHTPDPANKRKEILLVSKTREERCEWMIHLQEQNPFLVSPEQKISPDTPIPTRKRAASVPSNSLNVPLSELTVVPSFDELVLNVEDGDSDHEAHEPDDEMISFKGATDELTDTIITVPSFPSVTVK